MINDNLLFIIPYSIYFGYFLFRFCTSSCFQKYKEAENNKKFKDIIVEEDFFFDPLEFYLFSTGAIVLFSIPSFWWGKNVDDEKSTLLLHSLVMVFFWIAAHKIGIQRRKDFERSDINIT